MKVGPAADYPVRVRRQEWEEEDPLYAGIFAVALNHYVDIVFIPDLSPVAPPWDDRSLPGDLDRVETVEQARLATALLSSYVVTPNEARAGADEAFEWPPGQPDNDHVVHYVTGEEFAAYTGDLDQLTAVAANLHAPPPVSALRDHPVVRFIEDRIVASSRLRSTHAVLLGRTPPTA